MVVCATWFTALSCLPAWVWSPAVPMLSLSALCLLVLYLACREPRKKCLQCGHPQHHHQGFMGYAWRPCVEGCPCPQLPEKSEEWTIDKACRIAVEAWGNNARCWNRKDGRVEVGTGGAGLDHIVKGSGWTWEEALRDAGLLDEDKKQPGPPLDELGRFSDRLVAEIQTQSADRLMNEAKARVAAREAEEAKLSAANNPLDYIGRIEALEVNHRKQQALLRQVQEALGNIHGISGGELSRQAREGFQNLTNRYALAERATETRRRRAAAAKKKKARKR